MGWNQTSGDLESRLKEIAKQAEQNAQSRQGCGVPHRNFEPTAEQEEAVRQFSAEEPLKLVGYAGAAKTSTLELLARSTSRRGLYLAFNKAITQEARKRFPSNVSPKTTHGLALREVGGKYDDAKLFNKTNANAVVNALDIGDQAIGGAYFTKRQIAACVLGTITRFCSSGDSNVESRHVDLPDRLAVTHNPQVANALAEHAFKLATNLWPKMIDKNDRYPLGHDGYLKLWSLLRPRIATDYILLDEAQDTNPCVIEVLKAQPAQLIFVGDPSQQIYQWRGAVDAMQRIPSNREAYLTKSFRFGDSLAEIANVCLGLLGRSKPLRGNAARITRVGSCKPVAILARSNAGAIRAVLDALSSNQTPFILGVKDELIRLLEAVSSLKAGVAVIVPEFFGYEDWSDVVRAVRDEVEPGLKILVDLVEAHGEGALIATLKKCPDDELQSDVVISTIHKAKGREWDSVQIVDDFPAPAKIPAPKNGDLTQAEIDQAVRTVKKEELRLLYVGMTRARTALMIPQEIDLFLRSFRPVSDRYWSQVTAGSGQQPALSA